MAISHNTNTTPGRLAALFFSTFAMSLTTNSGYAILASMKTSFVDKHAWLSEDEMADYMALAQSAPGPIAVNASVVVGWQMAGAAGVACAVAGVALPPLLSMIVISVLYDSFAKDALVASFMRGMQLGVVAMLINVVLSMTGRIQERGGVWPWLIVVASFAYVRLTRASILWLALACVSVGVARAAQLAHSSAAGGDT